MAITQVPNRVATYGSTYPAPGDVDVLMGDINDLDGRLGAFETVTTVSKTASFTLAAADAGKTYEITSSSAVVVTVPTNASVSIAVGKFFYFRTLGTGTVTFSSSATLRSLGSAVAMAGQYAECMITKRATDEWVLSGALA